MRVWIYSFRFATLLAQLLFLLLVRCHTKRASCADLGWSERSVHGSGIERVCLQGEPFILISLAAHAGRRIEMHSRVCCGVRAPGGHTGPKWSPFLSWQGALS